MNFESQIDAFTETGGAGEGISAPGPVRRNPFLACRKGAAVPLLKRGPILKVSVIAWSFWAVGEAALAGEA